MASLYLAALLTSFEQGPAPVPPGFHTSHEIAEKLGRPGVWERKYRCLVNDLHGNDSQMPPPGGRGSPPLSSNNTWLRGGYPTNENGVVELTTLYPGFYVGRTVHVHMIVHTDWEESENGQVSSFTLSLALFTDCIYITER